MAGVPMMHGLHGFTARVARPRHCTGRRLHARPLYPIGGVQPVQPCGATVYLPFLVEDIRAVLEEKNEQPPWWAISRPRSSAQAREPPRTPGQCQGTGDTTSQGGPQNESRRRSGALW